MTWIWFGAAGYLLILLVLFLAQRSLLYPASKERPDIAAAPGFFEVHTVGRSGQRLLHWLHPPAGSDAPLVVVFHGNAGHIGHRVEKFRVLLDAGYGLALAGYRGYGGNPGRPSEAGLLEDARAFLDRLEAEGYRPERTVLYGESLGTGVAVAIAAEDFGARSRPARAGAAGAPGAHRGYAGVVLEAPYTSIAEVAQATYWFVPAKWLVKDRWDSLSRIDALAAPLLVVMGERDQVIPPGHGRRLFAAAPEPKRALFVREVAAPATPVAAD